MSHPAFKTKFSEAQIEAFLGQTYNARLATAVRSAEDPAFFQTHNVPVWYLWDGSTIWISAFQSTRKLKEALKNPYISVIVDTEQPFQGVQAVLFEGKAEAILESSIVQEMSRQIYTRYLGEQGVKDPAPQSWIVDPDNAIIKLPAQKVYTW